MGAPQDRPGPENKVTFSAQQPGCLIIVGPGACGAAASLPPVFILNTLYLDTMRKD